MKFEFMEIPQMTIIKKDKKLNPFNSISIQESLIPKKL